MAYAAYGSDQPTPHRPIHRQSRAPNVLREQLQLAYEQVLVARCAEQTVRRQRACQATISRRIERLKRHRRALGPHEQAARLHINREIKRSKQQQRATRVAHQRAQAELREAEQSLSEAHAMYRQAIRKQTRFDSHRSIAERAGVSVQYLDHLRVIHDAEGSTHFYFGGVGKPDGEHHGHYVVDRFGYVTYRRNPCASRGRHNFVTLAHRHDPVAAL